MQWLRNMKIGARLTAAFVAVACIAGANGAMGVVNIRAIDARDTELYEENAVPLGALGMWIEGFYSLRIAARDVVISDDPAFRSEKIENVKALRQTIAPYLATFESGIRSEEERGHYDRLVGGYEETLGIIDDIVEAAQAGDKATATELLYGPGAASTGLVAEEAVALMEMQTKQAGEKSAANTTAANQAAVAMIAMAVVGMVAAIGLGLYISRMISRPVRALVDASRKVAGGDLNVTIDVESKDEIGALAEAFAEMTERMNEVLLRISNASEQVASGSRQVSEASQSLSHGSNEQASSIQQITSSMEQIASQTKRNAAGAGQAHELASATAASAEQGNARMREMLAAMDGMNEASANISKIIKVIDDIAFQTNILALNAAVEAARAGQHGKGFAVVAEEVRSLAARSANAAKETTTLIEGSIRKVEAGTRIANETAVALERIVAGATDAAGLVGSIATASNEQAIGIAQANQGIGQVSEVIQANSATSEECAAASEQLSGQSEQLRELVGTFRLRRQAGRAGGVEAAAPADKARIVLDVGGDSGAYA